jgi:peptidoglycan/xylan/chitin deacetylase (PgdA/CDA1 family)
MFRYLLIVISILFTCHSLYAADHVVVLQYHHFSSTTSASTSIRPWEFQNHVDYLKRNGFTVWPLKKSLSFLRQGKSVPDKCVVITIDDAYISVYTNAYPVLKEMGWPFTVFVATESVDKGRKVFLSWDQMREMQKHGVDFEMHSHTHPYLVRNKKKMSAEQWALKAKQEIFTSRQRIEEELGYRSGIFAYPFGEYDQDLKKIVLESGLIGVGQHSGAIWSGSDWGALPRYPMSGPYAELKDFAVKLMTLPLPVTLEIPVDPVLDNENNAPVLNLTLGEGSFDPGLIKCYASGQGLINTHWFGQEKRLQVSPNRPLTQGRSRYNCTVRHKDVNRYYWFSRQWLLFD